MIKAGALGGTAITSPQGTVSGNDSTPDSSHNQLNTGSLLSSSTDHIHNVSERTTATANRRGSSYEPSLVEAEESLANFRTYKSKYFPFVHIPSTTTAQHLRQERPFLWLCIVAIGSKSTSTQEILGRQVRQTIAQELIVQSSKNIDLLLGLLAFVGWYGIVNFPIRESDADHSCSGPTIRSRANLFWPSLLSSRSLWCSILDSTSPFLKTRR
jgi:hypothetical protein